MLNTILAVIYENDWALDVWTGVFKTLKVEVKVQSRAFAEEKFIRTQPKSIKELRLFIKCFMNKIFTLII